MNHMPSLPHIPSTPTSSVEPLERISFQDQGVLSHEIGFRCCQETGPSSPCLNYSRDGKFEKGLSPCRFEALTSPDNSDGPISSSGESDYFDSPVEHDYCDYLGEQSDEVNQEDEQVFILGLDMLERKSECTISEDNSSYHSVTEDSLKVMRRRMAKKKQSQMKTLSNFRRSFARQSFTDSEATPDLPENRNITSPPCA